MYISTLVQTNNFHFLGFKTSEFFVWTPEQVITYYNYTLPFGVEGHILTKFH